MIGFRAHFQQSSTTKLGDGISPETGRWYLPRQNLAGNLAMDVREGENMAMGSSNTKLGDGISPETGRRYLPRQNLAGSSLETMVSATTKFSDGSSLETVVSATTKFGDGSSLETGRWYLPRQNLAMEALAGNGPVVFAPTKFGDGNSLETGRWYPPRQNLAMEARWKRAGARRKRADDICDAEFDKVRTWRSESRNRPVNSATESLTTKLGMGKWKSAGDIHNGSV
ncbi:hypothetical protein ACFX2B_045717 [Malus domestica]